MAKNDQPNTATQRKPISPDKPMDASKESKGELTDDELKTVSGGRKAGGDPYYRGQCARRRALAWRLARLL
jgi:bacteriocin-like protein